MNAAMAVGIMMLAIAIVGLFVIDDEPSFAVAGLMYTIIIIGTIWFCTGVVIGEIRKQKNVKS